MSSRGRARVGCSGWDYPEWRGSVYPPDLRRREWFGWYASQLDTVELNATFYRLPSPTVVDGWAASAPPGFVYSVKLGQFGSHRMKLRDAARWLPNHIERVDRLGLALGPTLVQLPPRWRRDAARLDDFLSVAPPRYRWTVELRDQTWLHDDVFEVLRRHGAALCLHDLLPGHPWEVTADWVYLRFHGPDATVHPYRGRYTGRRLGPIARRLQVEIDAGHDVYAYFNNDIGGAAFHDARWLASRLSGTTMTQDA